MENNIKKECRIAELDIGFQGCKTLKFANFPDNHHQLPVALSNSSLVSTLQVFLKVALKSLPFLVSKTNEVDVFNGMSIFPSEALQDSSDFSSSWNLDERNLHQGI